MSQRLFQIYLFKPEGEEDKISKWIYYRVDPDIADENELAISRVRFPGCEDIPEPPDDPGDAAAANPGGVGVVTAGPHRDVFLKDRFGVEHNKSILIGTIER
jgi:hypothetical protein